jgi:hypothetical protein
VRKPQLAGREKLFFPMDFAGGVAEAAASIRDGQDSRLSGDFTLHVLELALSINTSGRWGRPVAVHTTFAPVAPMPWAR